MTFFGSLFTLALLATSSFAAPTGGKGKSVEKYNGEKTGKYIVKFKDGADVASALGNDTIASLSAFGTVVVDNADKLDELLKNGDVEYVAEDGIVTTQVKQTDAPWGLARVASHKPLAQKDDFAIEYNYRYSKTSRAVDVYVVDTGVYTHHEQFQGRARWGWAAPGYAKKDGHGHGTHCAGTIASKRYGIHKSAHIVAVKVLSDSGSGSIADVVSGLEWVGKNVKKTGRRSVVSMSLGGGASTPLDDAVRSLISQGIPVVVAAGNSNADASESSPARVAQAITVGATDIYDAKASFSNYGAIVDVHAPGVNIWSTWIGSKDATNNISGTSMATPHVAGLVSYLLSLQGTISPAKMSTKIKAMSSHDVITGLVAGTPNRLIDNGYKK